VEAVGDGVGRVRRWDGPSHVLDVWAKMVTKKPKTGYSRGNFPGLIREPEIWSGEAFN
jgi:hypothetical protein